jgi:hypothetical protein
MGEKLETIKSLVNFLFDTEEEKHIYRMCAYQFYRNRILEENQNPFEKTIDEIIYWSNSKK